MARKLKPARPSNKPQPRARAAARPAPKPRPGVKRSMAQEARRNAAIEEKRKKRGRGRPSLYTEELGNFICDEMAEGKTLLELAQNGVIPDRGTIYGWLDDHPDFRIKFARAREAQAHFYFEKVAQIAFDESKDRYTDAKGRVISDHARVARARLQVDSMKFMAAKLFPKFYGEKTVLDIPDQPVVFNFSWMQPPPTPPALPPEPPKQLAYLPSIADEIDQALIGRLVEAIKRHVPRADERSPNEVIEEVADIITSALAAHYRT